MQLTANVLCDFLECGSESSGLLPTLPQASPFLHVVVDVTALQNQVLKLEEENTRLRTKLDEKEKLLGETIVRHQDELVTLRVHVNQAQAAEEILQDKYETLREKYGALQKENERLTQLVDAMQKQIGEMESRIRVLESRDHPITVREAMRVLESHICIAICGSKRKAKNGLCTLKKVSQSADPTISNAYNRFMTDRGLSVEHQNLLAFLKDHDDEATHDKRPLLTASELLAMSYAEDDEEDDKRHKQIFSICSTNLLPKMLKGVLS